MFPQRVSGMMNSRIKSGKLSKSGSWVSRIKLTFSAVMEVSVVSTEIGSFRGSADGGSASAESNAWDSSSAPRAGWDAMLDSWERTKSVIESHFWEEDELFTWAADVLVLRSLFPVVVFWVAPGTALRFGDWHVMIVGTAWVLINCFREGAVDPILETRHGGW